MFDRTLAGLESLAIYVGDRMGLYRALADGPLTASQLAERCGMHARFAREWLEQQAVAGVLTVDVDVAPPSFALPPAHARVLTDESRLSYSSPLARFVVAAAAQLPALMDAYRAGTGVPWSQFGADAREAQGDINRPWFASELAAALAGVADLHASLSRPGARIADIGSGLGWSTIALARAYPDARVEGWDVDAPSVETARRNGAGIPNLTFVLSDGADVEESERPIDVAFVFEALHDMPHPVEVLAAVRRSLRDNGSVVVMDEAVADEFAADGDELERIMYAFSLFICLPDSMATPGSAATGTVMRPSVLAEYARAAGFSSTETLPIEDFAAFRFYRLRPERADQTTPR